MLPYRSDGSGAEWIEAVQQAGYDYIELSLAHLSALPEPDFARLKQRLECAAFRCEACNNFFPKTVRLTGREVNPQQVKAYIHHSLNRAAALGVQTVVFGSSGAKNVPPCFPYLEAWQQIIDTLHWAADEARLHGITIAIEPLNHQESNIVNTLSDGIELMRQVNRDEIKVLVDYYHLFMEQENPSILLAAGTNLRHVHIAQTANRVFPLQKDAALDQFFFTLNAVPYTGRVSVEGVSEDFSRDASQARVVLKQYDPNGKE
jgi:sugar phosphate isomerase/epimerase